MSHSSLSLRSGNSDVPENGLEKPNNYDEEAAIAPGPVPKIPQRNPSRIKVLDPFLVKWDAFDRENPFDWSTSYKSWITFQLGMLALAASLASSIISPANSAISEYLKTSRETTILCISLYIVGFIFGPLFWAPISEIWGRRVSLLPATVGLGLFSIGTALSKNPQTLFITRLFGGFFGSAPVSNVAAALGDIWRPKARGTAMTLYAIAVVGGPTLGPVIGGVFTAFVDWRWTEYFQAIFTFSVVILCFFCLPEVYGPTLLKTKAERLRKETGNSRYHHPHELVKLDFETILTKHLTRPIVMLLTEPMVSCIAVYASFVFALLYMTLEIFPIVFAEHRRWSPFVSTLPFSALFVGVLCAVFINLENQPRYIRAVDDAGGKPVPEARLVPMAVGAVLFAVGLFLFGWTASPSIPWPISIVAIGFIGAGFNTIFQQCINFLVDTYRLYAASATSANTFLRSCMAAGLPLAVRPMVYNLGVGPSMNILGGIAVLAIPVPFIFMKYGVRLRKKSRFAPVDEE